MVTSIPFKDAKAVTSTSAAAAQRGAAWSLDPVRLESVDSIDRSGSNGKGSPRPRISKFSKIVDEDVLSANSAGSSDEELEASIQDIDLAPKVAGFAGGGAASEKKSERSLVKQVDIMECALGVAFRDHRARIERILDENVEAMEEVDRAIQLDMSRLRAENANLREIAGLRGKDSSLWQTVMLDASAAAGDKKEQKRNLRKPGCDFMDDEGVPDQWKASAKDKDAEAQISPEMAVWQQRATQGGVWQSFVCWVPTGAGLERPEPWKPLPEKTLLASLNESAELHESDQEEEAEERDQLAALVEKEKKKRFEVVDVFAATVSELETSRRSLHIRRTEQEEKKQLKGQRTDEEKELLRRLGSQISGDEHTVFESDTADFFVIHPHSMTRNVWEISSLLLVIYDMVTIPLGLFDLGDPFFLIFMSWMTRVFWTVDMAMSAATGVVMPDGTVRGDARFIVRRYVRTWFGMDFFIVLSDWLELVASASAGAGFLGRMSRAFRIVRIVRLLRLARMRGVIEQVTERIQSDKLAFSVSIIKFMLILVSMAHVTACVWWGIGDRVGGPDTWVEKYEFHGETVQSQYLMCLHFALAQFTGGMDEVAPANALERLYVIALFIMAFVAAALIVSVLTSNLTQMHIIGGGRSRQVKTLRTFLKQNQVSSKLVMRMTRSAQHALSADLTADVVELLPVVAEPLRVEMHFEMYTAILSNHQFFADYIQDAPQVMRRVCHYAMSTVLLSHGDVVFSRGEVPSQPKMYFLIKGTADYEFSGDTTALTEKNWVAEPVLWTRWKHVGCLTVTSEVKMAAVDAKAFQDISDRFKDNQVFDPKLYAADFVSQLNDIERVSDVMPVRYKYGVTNPSTHMATKGHDTFASKTASFMPGSVLSSAAKQMYDKAQTSHSIVPMRQH